MNSNKKVIPIRGTEKSLVNQSAEQKGQLSMLFFFVYFKGVIERLLDASIVQQQIQFSAFFSCTTLLFPKTNPRKINEPNDFNFIYQELVGVLFDNGRTAESSPVRTFKISVTVETIYTLFDVDVVEAFQVRYVPSKFPRCRQSRKLSIPVHWTKSRKLRLKDARDLLNSLIGKTVSIAIERALSPPRSNADTILFRSNHIQHWRY